MNWELGIALYAAGISTLVLIWKLVEYYLEKAGRIKVVVKIMPRYKLWADPTFDDPTQKLIVTVTNFSKPRRIIEAPNIVTDIKIKEENIFTLGSILARSRFPITLESGEKKEFYYDKDEYYHYYKGEGVTKIQISFTDTLNKSYKSKWVSLP
jgi:hypothetical protein